MTFLESCRQRAKEFIKAKRRIFRDRCKRVDQIIEFKRNLIKIKKFKKRTKKDIRFYDK